MKCLSASLGDAALTSVEVRIVAWSRHGSFTDGLPSFQRVDIWKAAAGRPAIILIISPTFVACRDSIHHGLLSSIPIGYGASHLWL